MKVGMVAGVGVSGRSLQSGDVPFCTIDVFLNGESRIVGWRYSDALPGADVRTRTASRNTGSSAPDLDGACEHDAMSSGVVAFEPGEGDEWSLEDSAAAQWAPAEAAQVPAEAALATAAQAAVLPAGVTAARLGRIRLLQAEAISEGTRRMYQREWGRFVAFCTDVGADSLPAHPLTVAAYFEAAAADGQDDAGTPYASNTFNGWLAAIDKWHELAGYDKPSKSAEVATTMAGLRRTNGGELRRMPALLLEELRALVGTIDMRTFPRGVHGVRDTALILMGFAGAFRRSELAALNIGDVTLHETDGLHVRVRRSKTDQHARGRTKALPYGAVPATCPVCAFTRWILLTEALSSARPRMAAMKLLATFTTDEHVCARGHTDDNPVDWSDPLPAWRRLPKRMPLFRPISTAGKIFRDSPISGQVVQDAIVRHALNAGLDAKHYGGHSLRAGFVTSALKKGLSPHQIMRQSWHTTERMIEVYGREDTPLDNNAVTEIGL
ncbi:site-specific integrase [Curtobacterium sp. ISL-83]|uniref:site-specific integrase n=1 Tax=Curtobacterium sp. ISL-83 TaxID=2819145 RepID=UPI001BE59B1F|nr:site-specific integrase [Curtobacterium sp. ISL-83]MBT2504189.1 site-specific integrase [Curtobacterium sp. ISL-83]